VVLPNAPQRKFLVGGEDATVAAWFEPRMNAASGGVQSWKCGGVDAAVAAAQRLVHAESAARGGGGGVPAAPGKGLADVARHIIQRT